VHDRQRIDVREKPISLSEMPVCTFAPAFFPLPPQLHRRGLSPRRLPLAHGQGGLQASHRVLRRWGFTRRRQGCLMTLLVWLARLALLCGPEPRPPPPPPRCSRHGAGGRLLHGQPAAAAEPLHLLHAHHRPSARHPAAARGARGRAHAQPARRRVGWGREAGTEGRAPIPLQGLLPYADCSGMDAYKPLHLPPYPVPQR
jgi:hypothetical protein